MFSTNEYRDWVRAHGALSEPDRVAIRAEILKLPLRPLFSVLLDTRSEQAAIERSALSLRSQLYRDFEVCFALRHDEATVVRQITEPLGGDVGVRLASLSNLSPDTPAARRNAALAAANGDFVLCLDAGDCLAEQALFECAAEIAGNPKTAAVYSDEDCLDAEGSRHAPCFKTGWDPDLMLSHDMLGRLAAFRRDLALRIGGFRQDFEGAEDHDFALRATAELAPFRIRHIPAVLYHRAVSMCQPEGSLTRRADASRRAVRAFLDQSGQQLAQVRPNPMLPHWHRIHWPLPDPVPHVSIIVPTRDRAELLRSCAEGVLTRTDYENIELVIVDNGSAEDQTLKLFSKLSADPRVQILRSPGPFNFSALMNLGARQSVGEILLLLNNDIEVIDDAWLGEMVSQVLRPDVGAVGAKLIYPDGRIQHGGVILGPGRAAVHELRLLDRNDVGYLGHGASTRSLLAVTGACLAVKRSVFEEVGGLDQVNLPVSYNDVDFCLRIGDRGYRILWTPFAELFHVESASRGYDDQTPEKAARARRELEHLWTSWGSLIDADPFHNPNLLFTWDHPVQLTAPRRKPSWGRAPVPPAAV
jgi:GT2 family glycosyltransferase